MEKLFNLLKEEMGQTIKTLALKLEQKSDEIWREIMDSLQTAKLKLEEEIKALRVTKEDKEKQINTLSNEVIKLSEAKDRDTEIVENLTRKQEEAATKLVEAQERIGDINDRELALEAKDREVKEKLLGIKAREINLEEKNKRIKRIMSNLGE